MAYGLYLLPSCISHADICRPDHCDGTYDANCDASREYTNISSIISAAGQSNLLSYMNVYWKDYQGNDESFWEHQHTATQLLHQLCPTRGSCGFFRKDCGSFQDSQLISGWWMRQSEGHLLIVMSTVPLSCRNHSLIHHYIYCCRNQRCSQGTSRCQCYNSM